MNTFYMAAKNLKKKFSFYSLYLVSVAFVITVYFSFASFSSNAVILEKISEDGRVETMCRTIAVFLMIFVIFYMSYSNRFFLRRRTKELGIYTLLGYRKSTILSLLTFENIFVCGGAFIVGIILGGLVHKGLVCGINMLLDLSINSQAIPFWNWDAVRRTLLFISAVVIVLMISNGRFLYRTSLMSLVRYEKSTERKMKFHKVPSILGIFMVLGGYALALDIIRGEASVWVKIGFYQMGLLTMMLVVTGTVLFIASFLPYIMEKSKKRKASFYTKDKIITIPSFIYRIRSNAKTLIMLTLLSAAALTVSSVMALTLYYPIAAVQRIAPSEIEFRVEKEEQVDEVKQIVEKELPDTKGVSFTRTDLYKVCSSSKNLPPEYSLGAAQNDTAGGESLREPGFECMSFASYQALLNAQGRTNISSGLTALSDKECILIKYQAAQGDEHLDRVDSGRANRYSLMLDGTKVLVTVRETSLNNVISFANSIGTLVVSDQLYEQISSGTSPVTHVFSINGEAVINNEALYDKISVYLDASPYLQGNSHRINELLHLNSSTFLLIGFLVVLFFIAAGSILYFNNLSSVMDSRADYEILKKLGYRKKTIKRLIRKQILVFFSIPFLLGLLDCMFAALIYKTGLMQNILENSLLLYLPVFIAVGITAGIYLIYYLVTVRSCDKILFRADRV
ncbi:ABC transporter permease [Faecalicatena sp. AGMB00832]|uniref:ABC transporter permease n=1 Tax=Faecalicatena faecalis TaxID=2726362 RepID=A0ABS6D6M5_9FIRM|nr:FtsX-like permease family protein [Faecalicatena faecalis]MBU3877230.1 ABC transporter permease [Faecalicatena faecalis]